MKKLLFLMPLLALCACGTLSNTAAGAAGLPPSPSAMTEATQLDETLLTTAELAYKGARIAVEIGVDANLIRGASATRFRDLNRRAFAALGLARTAYRAGNASSYYAALAEVRNLSNDLLTLTGRNSP